jgi:aminoglycoside 3-N-acetyltransferase
MEEVCGVNSYRFPKTFTGQYIDAEGRETTRSYSMLVRSYELYEETDLTLIGEKMEAAGAARLITLNDLPYRIVDLAAAAPVIADDILHNASRGLCKHKLQG